MIRRIALLGFAGSLLALTVLVLPLLAQGQGTGVVAEAVGTANLRAQPNIESEKVGQIANGTQYPVIGRSEFYPWLLLGEVGTQAPKGWVFRDLVTVTGNVNAVPFSTTNVLQAGQPTTAAPSPTSANIAQSTPEPENANAVGPTATLQGNVQVTPMTTSQPVSPTPDAAVTGTTMGEINLRYGPGVDYQVVGRAAEGQQFEVTGYHTQFPWLQIRYAESPTGFAWVAESLLEVNGNVFDAQAVTRVNFDQPTLTPTPAMRASSNIPGQEPVPVSQDFAELGDRLWNFVLSQDFVPESSRFGALYLQNLQTDEAITYGDSFAFSGTSINKIAILMSYFGALDGTPNLSEARDIANTMICSENVATNRLLGIVGEGDMLAGADRATEMLRELGLTRTFITAPYDTTTESATATPMPRAAAIPTTEANQSKSSPNPTNQMTVEEMGWLLGNMYQCAYDESGPLLNSFDGAYTPQECRKMLYVMSENTVDGLLKAGVPSDTTVAHKHGWINDTHGNAGVFFTPGGDYVMVMMLHQPNFLSFSEDSLPTLAEASRMVYNFFNPDQPMQSVREGYIPGPDECNYTTTSPIVQNLAASTYLLENDPELSYQGDAGASAAASNVTPTLRPTWTPAGGG